MPRLDTVNGLAREALVDALKACCGSSRWAQSVAQQAPFDSVAALHRAARRAFDELGREDWLEAFRAHPRIGEQKSATQGEQGNHWSAGEQDGVARSEADTRAQLARLNERYYEAMGFIFIICATGKSAELMLSELRRRVNNDRDTEIATAAAEQRKITELRLEKWMAE